MKSATVVLLSLAVLAVVGCGGPKGGGPAPGEGFRLSSPFLTTKIAQGDRKTVNVSVKRDDYFKEDVKLETTTTPGIEVDPEEVVVKASDPSEVQFQITAPEDAALGEYRVRVTGTPDTGVPTSTEIKVKVVTP